MSPEQVTEVASRFVDGCIQPDFVHKFLREFGFSRRVGDRFFRAGYRIVEPSNLREFLGVDADSSLRVRRVVGSYKDRRGYNLVSEGRVIDSLFADDVPSMAVLEQGKRVWFVLYDDYGGVCVVWPSGGQRFEGSK
jgi:hypothetical protein